MVAQMENYREILNAIICVVCLIQLGHQIMVNLDQLGIILHAIRINCH